MNSSEKRMVSLAGELGLDVSTGSVILAEIKSFSKGIEMVGQEIIEMIDMFDFSSEFTDKKTYAFKMLCSAFNIGDGNSSSSKKKRIKEALSQGYGKIDISRMRNDLSMLELDMQISQLQILISGSITNDAQTFKNAISVIKNYIYPGIRPNLSGDGLTFYAWNNLGLTFVELDNADLPFMMIDTLM